METKKCTGCNTIKLVSEFNKRQAKCKVCQKEYSKQYCLNNAKSIKQRTKQYYQDNIKLLKQRTKQHQQDNPEYYKQYYKQFQLNQKDGKHHVYLLPEVNYVGVTDNIYKRMAYHKHYNNISTTSSYEILHQFRNRDCALIVEDYYHELGWKGKKGEQNKNLLYAVRIN